MKHLVLPLWTLLLVSCSSSRQEKREEDMISLPFEKPRVEDFAGEYRITNQTVAEEPDSISLVDARLYLRSDTTYEFTKFPVFQYREGGNFVFNGFEHYSGRWTIAELGSAYDKEAGKRRPWWACDFRPVPGGASKESLDYPIVEPYVNKRTGLVHSVLLYYGDMDSGDVIRYERIAGPPSKEKNK